jgi:hypothetical protein
MKVGPGCSGAGRTSRAGREDAHQLLCPCANCHRSLQSTRNLARTRYITSFIGVRFEWNCCPRALCLMGGGYAQAPGWSALLRWTRCQVRSYPEASASHLHPASTDSF